MAVPRQVPPIPAFQCSKSLTCFFANRPVSVNSLMSPKWVNKTSGLATLCNVPSLNHPALSLQHTLIKQCYLISNKYALKLPFN